MRMFSEFDMDNLHRQVCQQRFSEVAATEVVLASLKKRYDFGHDMFHKVLLKSVLKPESRHDAEQASSN